MKGFIFAATLIKFKPHPVKMPLPLVKTASFFFRVAETFTGVIMNLFINSS